jgi:hypothetical protein
MFLEELQKKRDYLLSLARDADASMLVDDIRSATRHFKQIPEGTKASICEALAYAVLKHRTFATAPIFAETLSGFVTGHFGLPGPLAKSLVASALDAVTGSGDPHASSTRPTDKDFLRYLFVHVACTDDESDLVAELGLGTEMLGCMKRAIEIVAAIKDAEADAPLMFLPDLDSQVCEIMAEISQETVLNPWALQLSRLRYHVTPISESPPEVMVPTGIDGLFDILLHIGIRKLCTTKHISEYFRKRGKDNEDKWDLFGFLQKFDLAYPDGPKDSDKTKWTLTPFSRSLTREAFSQVFLEENENILKELPFLPPEYQSAVVKRLSTEDKEKFISIARFSRPLAPQAFSAALAKIQASGDEKAVYDIAFFTLLHDPSPWLRKTACRSLATTPRTDEVDQVFAEVARSDASLSVRAEARTILRQIKAEESDGCHGPQYGDSKSIAAQLDTYT